MFTVIGNYFCFHMVCQAKPFLRENAYQNHLTFSTVTSLSFVSQYFYSISMPHLCEDDQICWLTHTLLQTEVTSKLCKTGLYHMKRLFTLLSDYLSINGGAFSTLWENEILLNLPLRFWVNRSQKARITWFKHQSLVGVCFYFYIMLCIHDLIFRINIVIWANAKYLVIAQKMLDRTL